MHVDVLQARGVTRSIMDPCESVASCPQYLRIMVAAVMAGIASNSCYVFFLFIHIL